MSVLKAPVGPPLWVERKQGHEGFVELLWVMSRLWVRGWVWGREEGY